MVNLTSVVEWDEVVTRHFLDSASVFLGAPEIGQCEKKVIDIGTGGGMPGIIIAIIAKNLKNKMKFNLYEKSHHKSEFLKEVSKKLNLNTVVIKDDVFKSTRLKAGTILVRAFKPLPIVLDLVHNNFRSYKNLIIFMGKNGKQIMKEAFKNWDFEYKQKRSIKFL